MEHYEDQDFDVPIELDPRLAALERRRTDLLPRAHLDGDLYAQYELVEVDREIARARGELDRGAQIESRLDELRQACGHPYDWEPLVDELDELIDELPPSTARDQFQGELERCRREGELTQGLLDAYEDVWMSEDSEWARERRERFGLSRAQLIDRAQRKADELRGESHNHHLHQCIREARGSMALEHQTSAAHRTLATSCTRTRSRESSGRTPVPQRGSRRSSSSDDPDEHDPVDEAAHRRPHRGVAV